MESSHGGRDLKEFKWKDLALFTENFSENNFIDFTQFGKVYHGTTPQGQEVTVKIWGDFGFYLGFGVNHVTRLQLELEFLGLPNMQNNPCLPKLIGYCVDGDNENLGVVYNLKSRGTLYNLIKTDDFTWKQRMRVALQFASLLKSFHSVNPPYLVRNIDAAHILIDQDFVPVLYDFSLLFGGVLGDGPKTPEPPLGPLGYMDFIYLITGHYARCSDIFAFGVVLLMLICKRVGGRITSSSKGPKNMEERCVHIWAEREFKRRRKMFLGMPSLVDTSLTEDSGFKSLHGKQVTKLAMRCIKDIDLLKVRSPDDQGKRPSMAEVVKTLQSICM